MKGRQPLKTGPTDQLRSWIDNFLSANISGTPLPTGTELANRFGLSAVTAGTVLRSYRDKGLLVRVRGRGSFVGEAPRGLSLPQARPGSSVEAVAQAVTQLIGSGVVKAGEQLPSLKMLCNQFHIAPATAIHAFRLLAHRGLVTRIGRGYWAGDLKRASRHDRTRTVFLLCDRSDHLWRMYQRDVLSRAYQRMEREFLVHGLRIRHRMFPDISKLRYALERREQMPAGLVLSALSQDESDRLEPDLAKLLCAAAHGSIPVLVDWTHGDHRASVPGTIVMSRGHILTSLVRELSAFLVRLGIRGAMFFFDEQVGSKYHWGISPHLRAFSEVTRANPEFQIRFAFRSECRDRDLDGLYDRLSQAVGIDLIRNELSRYSPNKPRLLAEKGDIFVEYEEVYRRRPELRTWVFLNSSDAAEACAWAAKNRVRIPRDLSIITLLGAPEHYHLGITTCEPDWETIGYQMAHAVIGDFPVRRTTLGFIATTALVLERDTTL